MTELNRELIKKRIKELGLTYTLVEMRLGMGQGRFKNLMQGLCRFKEADVTRLSCLLEIDEKEFGENVIKNGEKIKRPKPLKMKPMNEVNRTIVKKYAARKMNLQQLRRERGITFSKVCRENGLDREYITNIVNRQKPLFTIEILDLLAKELKCRISDIADIPANLDANYTDKKNLTQSGQPIDPMHWIGRYDPKDDPRYLENPVDHVIPIHQDVETETSEPLAEEPNRHLEHRINGVVAWRYQDGNAVLFANEHIKHEHILVAMEQIKKWGEKVARRGKS